jgi:hypothetical protein
MTQHFAENLILHRHRRFRSNRIPELPLNHRERRFDVGSLVVGRKELFRVQAEKVKRLLKHATDAPRTCSSASRELRSRLQLPRIDSCEQTRIGGQVFDSVGKSELVGKAAVIVHVSNLDPKSVQLRS